MPVKVLYISITLPSRTLTFVAREICELESLGVEIPTVSMNRPPRETLDSDSARISDRTLYLDSISWLEKLLGAIATLAKKPARFWRTLRLGLSIRDLGGPMDVARILYHFFEACYLHDRLAGTGIQHIHCHLLSGPTTLGMFLASLLGIPFSFTIHGSQVYRAPIALGTKLEHASFIASVTDFHRRYVVSKYGASYNSKFTTVRAGLSLERYPAVDRSQRRPGPARILSVGRLVELKGHHHLIRACGLLQQRGVDFACSIVGEGPEEPALSGLIAELGLRDRVTLVGARTQDQLPPFYENADLFALACTKDRDGAMDGLPVVLMEAMASCLPVVASDFVGIPELVASEQHGLLVDPADTPSLADALQRLIASPELRLAMGSKGRQRVIDAFDVKISARTLFDRFNRAADSTSN